MRHLARFLPAALLAATGSLAAGDAVARVLSDGPGSVSRSGDDDRLASGRSYSRARHAHHGRFLRQFQAPGCRPDPHPGKVRSRFPRGPVTSRDWPAHSRDRLAVGDDRRRLTARDAVRHGRVRVLHGDRHVDFDRTPCGCLRPDRCLHSKRFEPHEPRVRVLRGDLKRSTTLDVVPCGCRRPDRCAHAKGLRQ